MLGLLCSTTVQASASSGPVWSDGDMAVEAPREAETSWTFRCCSLATSAVTREWRHLSSAPSYRASTNNLGDPVRIVHCLYGIFPFSFDF